MADGVGERGVDVGSCVNPFGLRGKAGIGVGQESGRRKGGRWRLYEQ